VILVDGVAAGTWGLRRTGGAARVALDPFRELDADTIRAIEAEVTDIGRFEGCPATLA
jgi:hypothetical protein